MNARGIPPARGCKMLTPHPTPHRLDLTPPPAGPDPPPCWLDLTPPPPAGPDPPLAGPDPPLPAGPDPPPACWTWPPPISWTWPPPPGVDWQTKWNYYLPVVLRTRAVISSCWLCWAYKRKWLFRLCSYYWARANVSSLKWVALQNQWHKGWMR